MTFKGTIKIGQEEDWFVATCLENNIASQGKTINEAMKNLKEAIALYYEDEANREDLNFQNEQVYITTLEMKL
jgi:predicted RNase H-like HicB family nuclease